MADDLQGCSVLVAEDIILIAEDIRDAVLGAGGCVIGPAVTIEAAVAAAERYRPDLATLNISLGGRNTVPLAEQLTQLEVPYVLVTGASPEALPAQYRSTPYVTKPFYRDELLKALVTAADPKRTA